LFLKRGFFWVVGRCRDIYDTVTCRGKGNTAGLEQPDAERAQNGNYDDYAVSEFYFAHSAPDNTLEYFSAIQRGGIYFFSVG
jgi:hypothetical protein